MKNKTYQQIKFMVEGGAYVTIDCPYNEQTFVVSISSTSVGSWSFDADTLPGAIQKAYDRFVDALGHTIGEDD